MESFLLYKQKRGYARNLAWNYWTVPQKIKEMVHTLLIAKLNAYGLRLKALKLMNNSEGDQRTKTNKHYSFWEQNLFWLPQGSILRPILFDIFLRDQFFSLLFLFFFLILNDIDFASYADDNTIPFIMHVVVGTLKLLSAIFYQIFIFNQMIALQKLWKMFFISSKKLFSFSRY